MKRQKASRDSRSRSGSVLASRALWALLGVAACLALGSPPAAAQTAAPSQPAAVAEPALPPPLTHYMGREIAPYMTYHGAPWLMRPERQQEEDCQRLLEALQVRQGQTVCDLGCGNGFYTLPLAERVGPKGRVLAVDIQREMLRLLEDRTDEAGIDNVELVLGSPIDPRLPAARVDLVLLVDVYHEFSYPEQMLRAIRTSLSTKGRVALVEFRGEDPEVPIKPLHKMTKAQINREFPANGFKLAEECDELPWQHLMFFERNPAWSPPAAPNGEPDR